MTIRVLLVDDQQLVREGLRRILHADEGFDIVGECSDGDEVEAAVTDLRPDLVVMDIRMKRVNGVDGRAGYASVRTRRRFSSSRRSMTMKSLRVRSAPEPRGSS